MTIIVHPVGQGDLRNDIVGLSSLERQDAQKEAQKKTKDLLDAKDAEGLLGLLLEPPAKDSRFSAPRRCPSSCARSARLRVGRRAW